MSLTRPGGLLHVSLMNQAIKREGVIRLRPTAPLVPVAASDAIASLVTVLDQHPGGPRWAVSGLATSLTGPWRDLPCDEDDGTDSDEGLAALLDRLACGPAIEKWPGWARGSRDPAILALGTGQGRPGLRLVVDVPPDLIGAVVTCDTDKGWARLAHPQPAPDRSPVLTWDARLQAVVAIVRHCGGPERVDHRAVRTLVGWVVGPGRAWCGRWACSRGLAEAHTAAARTAIGQMHGLDVDAVLADVMRAGAQA